MIPFNDLKAEFKEHQKQLEEAVIRVMKSGVYLQGPELSAFEDEFAKYLGTNHVIGVGSGTDALTLAIRALGLSTGDEVIIPANAYPTAFGVAAAGVQLRLCDVNPDTLVVDTSALEKAITTKTKAIIVVHLYGMPAPMMEIMRCAHRNGLKVIEDCAQAVGTRIGKLHVGTFGDVSIFSFYPTKNLGAMGDGGAVVTRSSEIAKRVMRLRMYGEDVRYHSLSTSTHSRLDEIQSAILRVKLHSLQKNLKKRDEVAQRYRLSLPTSLLVPRKIDPSVHHAHHLFVIRDRHSDKLKRDLGRRGIETLIHYPSPIHLQPAFSYLENHEGDFPISETASREILSIPLYPSLSIENQQRVIDAITEFFCI